MKVTIVRTVLYSAPHQDEHFRSRTMRSAAFNPSKNTHFLSPLLSDLWVERRC